MLAMGDELGRTQRGNNNAYAQDNALTWIDWPRADDALIAFTAALVALRKRHPALPAGPLAHRRARRRERPARRGMAAPRRPRDERRRLVGRRSPHARRDPVRGRLRHRAGGSRRASRSTRASIRSTVRWPAARDGYAWRVRVDTAPSSGRRDDAPFAHDESVVVAPRSTLVAVEEAEPADVVRRRRGAPADAELLGRLASAAGIEPAWWDLAGGRHVVGADTQRALLGAMGLSAASSGEARDRLAALADARERRALPALVVARADVRGAGRAGGDDPGAAPAPRAAPSPRGRDRHAGCASRRTTFRRTSSRRPMAARSRSGCSRCRRCPPASTR